MTSNALDGTEVKLGSERVFLMFGMRAMRAAFTRFKGRDVQMLLDDVRRGDFDAIVGLAACGLQHERVWSEDRISDVLDSNPGQVFELATAVMLAFSVGYRRTLPASAQAEVDKAGEAAAAAAKLSAPPAAEGIGPTSTQP